MGLRGWLGLAPKEPELTRRYYTWTAGGITAGIRARAAAEKQEDMAKRGWRLVAQDRTITGKTTYTWCKDPVRPSVAEVAEERRRAAAGHAFVPSAVTADLCGICSYEAKYHERMSRDESATDPGAH
jgi:hypothetical protein